MKNSFLPGDQHGYSGKQFEWNQLSFGTFYQFMRTSMEQYSDELKCPNLTKNFEDIFQETMITFYKLRQANKIGFETYGSGSYLVWRIFRFAAVNDYRREMRWRDLPLHTNFLSCQYEYVEPDIRPLHRCVELFFPEVDAYLRNNPELLDHRETQFYNLYKALVLKPLSDLEILLEISTEMIIKKGHYHNLKTQVIDKLETLVFQMSFVLR